MPNAKCSVILMYDKSVRQHFCPFGKEEGDVGESREGWRGGEEEDVLLPLSALLDQGGRGGDLGFEVSVRDTPLVEVLERHQ